MAQIEPEAASELAHSDALRHRATLETPAPAAETGALYPSTTSLKGLGTATPSRRLSFRVSPKKTGAAFNPLASILRRDRVPIFQATLVIPAAVLDLLPAQRAFQSAPSPAAREQAALPKAGPFLQR